MLEAFNKNADGMKTTAPNVKYILEEGIDVLIYNGNLDLACNTAGNIRWVEKMPWVGQTEFVSKDFETWYAIKDGEKVVGGTIKEIPAGKTLGKKKTGRFTFLTVDKSGHMVPLDQPEVGLNMIRTWMNGQEFDTKSELTVQSPVGDVRPMAEL